MLGDDERVKKFIPSEYLVLASIHCHHYLIVTMISCSSFKNQNLHHEGDKRHVGIISRFCWNLFSDKMITRQRKKHRRRKKKLTVLFWGNVLFLYSKMKIMMEKEKDEDNDDSVMTKKKTEYDIRRNWELP